MPLRVWAYIGVAIAIVAAAYVVLTVAAPRDEADLADASDMPVDVDQSGVAAERAAEPLPQDIDPAVISDIAAIAAERTAFLPQSLDNATLTVVASDQDVLTFTYVVPVDIDTMQVSDPLPPALRAFDCDEDVCVEADAAFVAAACSEEVNASIMDRGGKIVFDYRDENMLPLTAVMLSREVCR